MARDRAARIARSSTHGQLRTRDGRHATGGRSGCSRRVQAVRAKRSSRSGPGQALQSLPLAQLDHNASVLVPCRLESEQWVRWRVGLRRLAWRPSPSALELLQFADGPFVLLVGIPALGWWLATWASALLVTVVAWPTRVVSGRWQVVAYLLDHTEDNQMHCLRVQGREAAESTALQWASDIKRQGRPRLPADTPRPAPLHPHTA